jgi:hypothetical protein
MLHNRNPSRKKTSCHFGLPQSGKSGIHNPSPRRKVTDRDYGFRARAHARPGMTVRGSISAAAVKELGASLLPGAFADCGKLIADETEKRGKVQVD